MQADGRGWIYAPTGLLDGPLPTHYEPQESPFDNPLYRQQRNPARMEWRRADNPYHRPFGDPEHPYVVTTYRLTEHHTAGGMSRWLPWLSELQPELFCEVSPELAAERGLRNGEWATISTARAEIEARVLVTEPHAAVAVAASGTIHQIGLPYHWSSKGLVTGDTVNELIAFVADPNVSIQESKALTADIRPATARTTRATPVTADRDGTASREVGFFTDTTVCIGCKACEVACKQWNQLPDDGLSFTGMSYDNTVHLGASTWRHVAFVERPMVENTKFSWLLMSDVCKHCRNRRRVSTRARPGRSSAPSSTRCSCNPTSAMAAATACPPVRSVSSIAARTTAARGSARSATTGSTRA